MRSVLPRIIRQFLINGRFELKGTQSMLLSLITNDVAKAEVADSAGIDRIFVDLERAGKPDRQHGRSLFLADHSIHDVQRVRKVIRHATILVRIDSPSFYTREQIDSVIEYGASVVMLPYFHSLEQAAAFVEMVAGRATAALLVETPEAVALLPALCGLPGVGEIHVGLNDLSLALGRPFLFDVVADGTIDRICTILRGCGMPFGFGGIGSLARTDLPLDPESVLAEQVTQGATRGWLGRTFRDLPLSRVHGEVARIRKAIEYWRSADAEQVALVRLSLRKQIVAQSKKNGLAVNMTVGYERQ